MIRFNFDETKTLEALVYVARAWDRITPFYLSKVLFSADRNHLRAYGRPVTGDAYIAMVDGPGAVARHWISLETPRLSRGRLISTGALSITGSLPTALRILICFPKQISPRLKKPFNSVAERRSHISAP